MSAGRRQTVFRIDKDAIEASGVVDALLDLAGEIWCQTREQETRDRLRGNLGSLSNAFLYAAEDAYTRAARAMYGDGTEVAP